MANAWCINAIWFDWTLIQTLQQLDSSNIWVWVQYCAPNPLDDKRFDYIKYTDKCGCTCCLTWENEIMIYATQWVIKNLTLTNDDTNEVVNVKRTDLFWSNWKKTVVRYKTWWYPTSITDWTLAVEETTMNQYQSSWYNVSWLSDATTYYFSVFAVAQDDTIIVVQSSSIQTDFWRKPWADTILYLPFKTDLLDHSQTWLSLTTSWTISIVDWFAYFNGSSYMYSKSFTQINQTNFTASVRFKNTSTTNSERVCLHQFRYYSWYRWYAMWVNWTNLDAQNTYMKTNWSTTTVSANVRHNLILVRWNNTSQFYFDWEAITMQSASNYPELYWRLWIWGGAWYNWTMWEYKRIWYMSEIIYENKPRTSQDVSNYYNKTKNQHT